MNTSNINLKDLYFEYKVLPRIVGEPTFDSLHEMLKQLKANAAAVPCTLGGGANGYLVMLVSATQYNTVAPGTPFVPPPMPGPLVLNPGDTQYQLSMRKTQYETALKEHQTYVLMQRALISQVQQAVDAKYTNAVRNRVSGQLPADIRLVINHLFDTYGKISETELQTKYDETIKLTYQVSDPIDVIFNAVEDLCEIADLSGSPYTATQQVNIGFLIVSKQRILRSDVRKWMRKPQADKTWINFVTHFRQAHQELRDTDATIDELGYHSANAIVEQIVDRLREEHDYEAQPDNVSPSPDPAPTPPVPPPQANAVQPPIDPNLLLMQQMMQKMQTMQASINQMRGGSGQGRGRNNGNNTGRGRGRGRENQRRSRNGDKYCHTHGCCAHSSEECETPGPNHSVEANFNNMMGCSTRNCFWLE